MKLVHLSDPHAQLPRWRERKLRDLGPLRALATVELWKGRGKDYDEAAESLRALSQRAAFADHLVVTGDLTQLGEEEEFALARAALEPLASDPARFTALPGNHDRFPLRDFSPNRLFEKHFPEQVHEPSALRVKLVGDELALVVLDSAGEVSWPVISRGRLESAALSALSQTLRALEPHRCKLVLVHHAPLRRGGRQDLPWHRLQGARALLEAAALGGAAAVLCGHVHDRYDVPAAKGRARVLCAGSSTERGHRGFWELDIAAGKIAQATLREP